MADNAKRNKILLGATLVIIVTAVIGKVSGGSNSVNSTNENKITEAVTTTTVTTPVETTTENTTTTATTTEETTTEGHRYYILNTNTGKIHNPLCGMLEDSSPDYEELTDITQEWVEKNGYSACQKCNPIIPKEKKE